MKDTSFITSALGWAVGEPHWDQNLKDYTSTIIKTTDGGLSWMAETTSATDALQAVDFVDASNGWAAGSNGVILHTADGGAHWNHQNVATTDEFRSLSFVNIIQGWATTVRAIHQDAWGEDNNWVADVWHTTDGGATWTQQVLPAGASLLHGIDFVDAQSGYVSRLMTSLTAYGGKGS